jgi:hypothetical protein
MIPMPYGWSLILLYHGGYIKVPKNGIGCIVHGTVFVVVIMVILIFMILVIIFL